MMNKALTFDDVLLKPHYCGFESRKDVDTSCSLKDYKFQIPIISSNMDTITESEMAMKMGQLGGLGILHRFCSIEDNVKMFLSSVTITPQVWTDTFRIIPIEDKITPIVGVSIGVNEGLTRADALYNAGARIFCVDVAHGHSKLVRKTIASLKDKYSDILIIAGNVATPEGADSLVGWGADVVKVGIGPGCFIPGSMIKTTRGHKPIEEVLIGEQVVTHTGSVRIVSDLFRRQVDEDLIKVNNIICTQNHEFYVVNKSDQALINEENISEYAYWVSAESLNKENHMLIEME